MPEKVMFDRYIGTLSYKMILPAVICALVGFVLHDAHGDQMKSEYGSIQVPDLYYLDKHQTVVEISGAITDADTRQIVTVIITDPNFQEYKIEVPTTSNGRYTAHLHLDLQSLPGTYRVIGFLDDDRVLGNVQFQVSRIGSSGGVFASATQLSPYALQTLTILTDKNSYTNQDTISVFGTAPVSSVLTIQVFAPNNNLIHIDQINVDDTGNYHITIHADDALWSQEGKYTIRANDRSQTIETTFQMWLSDQQQTIPIAPPKLDDGIVESDDTESDNGDLKELDETKEITQPTQSFPIIELLKENILNLFKFILDLIGFIFNLFYYLFYDPFYDLLYTDFYGPIPYNLFVIGMIIIFIGIVLKIFEIVRSSRRSRSTRAMSRQKDINH